LTQFGRQASAATRRNDPVLPVHGSFINNPPYARLQHVHFAPSRSRDRRNMHFAWFAIGAIAHWANIIDPSFVAAMLANRKLPSTALLSNSASMPCHNTYSYGSLQQLPNWVTLETNRRQARLSRAAFGSISAKARLSHLD
jgi:hypothetical protein